jgi:hypothetical protein
MVIHPEDAMKTRTPAHCLRRAYEGAARSYELARERRDQAEGLEAMQALNDFLVSVAVLEASPRPGHGGVVQPLDLARPLR